MRDYRDTIADYAEGTEPDATTLAAVRRRVETRSGRRSPLRPLAVALPLLAAAAAVAWWVRPEPTLDTPLDAGAVALGPLVQVTASGSGHATGTARALHLDWTRGTLQVEVEPGQGVQLTVTTEEAAVRVVGTGFQVVRDVLGTRVDVLHGRVAVHCAAGDDRELGAGDTLTCLPTTAARRLGRLRELQATLAPDALLREADAAAALPDAPGAVAGELAALRTDALLRLGRDAEALAAAEQALATGTTRADELHRVAARLRLRADDCAGALPHLRALEAAGTLGADADALTTCTLETSP